MPRPKSLKPKLCHHKATGRAFVVIDGRFVYLGRHGTQAAQDAYDRAIGEWIANNRVSACNPSEPDSPTSITVSTIIAAFWRHAQRYYVGADGKQTPELENFRLAMRPLRRLYGATPAAEFGPVALKTIRSTMIKPCIERDEAGREMHRPGWSRNYANRQIARIRQIFKWAAAEQLLPATVHHALTTVEALKRGRCDARETEPVKPVHEAYVDAIRPFVSRQVAAMIDLQMLSGARSGELCIMRTCDIDRGGKVWLYRPERHKTLHHGHERIIRFGRRAQQILEPFLKPSLAAYVFSPADAEAERRERQREQRKTPTRREQSPKHERRRAPGDHYNARSYCRTIARACVKADLWAKGGRVIGNDERLIPSWHPHQLRHNFATNIRRDFGADAALTLLGDKTTRMIDVYAEKDGAKASEIIERVG